MNNLIKLSKEFYRIRKGFGLLFTLKYLFLILKFSDEVFRTKSLGVVDRQINELVKVKAFGFRFILLPDMMPTIRELLLKNCYLFDATKRYKTIVDLGANRGLFTVAASKVADKVISVECDVKEMPDKYKQVMQMNDVSNTYLLSKFASNFTDDKNISLNEIVKEFNLDEISFLKMDIEGSEKELFAENLEWLNITKEIAMEVHPCFGVDVHAIIELLNNQGFSTLLFDLDLRKVDNLTQKGMGYIRAKK